MKVGQIVAKLAVDPKEYEKALRKAEKQADKAGSKIGSIFKNAFSVTLGIGMFEALKKGFKSTVGTAISFNSMLQTAQIGFATMLGSAERAQKFLDDMADFAVKTPFEYPELLEAAKRMLAYGFAAEEVLPTLRAVGDASAALGSGSVGIDRITLALGQIRAKGKLSAEEMRQLTEAGVPAWHILAEAMGTTVPELQKMVSKGLIPGYKAVEMLTAGMTKRFGGMMASMEDTWQGVTSSIKEIWRMTVSTLTQNLFGGLNAMLIKVRDFLQQFYTMLQAVMGKKAKAATDVLANANVGLADGASAAAQSAEEQADAMNDLGTATEKAAKKANKNIQAFDEIHQLQEATGGAGGGGVGGVGDMGFAGLLDGLAASDFETEEPDLSWIDNLKAKLEEFKSTNFFQGISESIQIAIQNIEPQLENFKIIFGNIWRDIKLLAEPFAQWFNGEFTVMLQTGIETVGNIFAGLLESTNMVFSDIWSIAIYPIMEKWATKLLPTWSQVATEMTKTVDTLFTEVKGLFDMLWEQGVKPAMELIMKIWSESVDLIVEKWNTYGAPIFEGIRQAFQTTSDLIKTVWETILKPVWDSFMETVDWLWSKHLKPLLDKFLDFVAELILCATQIYNEFIAPLVNAFVKVFGPSISNAIQTIIDILGTIIGVVSDVVGGVIKVLKGIIQFITGVFTSDWEKAWEGIKNIFGGIWDSIVGVFKGAINLVIDGINTLIRGLNKVHFDIPDWVPIIGGKSFGISIPEIPKLARGAIVTSPTLAMIGERGPEAVVPLENNTGWINELANQLAGALGGRDGDLTVVVKLGEDTITEKVVSNINRQSRISGRTVITV